MNNNKGILNPLRLLLTLAILISTTGVLAVPAPPINLIVFPQRDFISASGYLQDDRVVVRVIHDPAVYPGATGGTSGEAAADWISPQGDPADAPGAFSGIVEVNHPGGACWKNQTPDIRPGDTVEIEIMANASDNTRVGRIDRTIVQNVTAKRPVQTGPGTVVVHGTAQDSFTAIPGSPLPVGILEHRIVAPGSLFANGRRTLRAASAAGADGTLAYDAPGSINWTATYRGLNAEDVTTALGAESRGMWLGNAVAPAVETTTYEIGALTAAGPGAPCTAALETLPPPPGSELIPPTNPTGLSASISNSNTVTLNWTASTDNMGVTAYGIYRNGQATFTVSNPEGDAPAPTTFVDPNTPPGTYTYQVKAFDEVGNGSGFSNTSGSVTAVQQVNVNTFPINDPPKLPINIIAFPSRDFISPSGYKANDAVTVQVLRRNPAGNDVIVSSAAGIIPDDGTFAEVNHPGGACWAGVTPEIRSGDTIRTIAYNPDSIGPGNPDGIRSVDQTFIAGVTAFKPVVVTPASAAGNEGVVEIHGTALGADGKPLPLGQIEQRMIATKDHFDFNGRRAMRAGANADGTLTYDTLNNPMGINWTARYTGLNADDVARMAGGTSVSTNKVFPGADTRIHWLGANPALLNEATIFENAPDGNPPGPAGPACTRPLETTDIAAPTTPGDFQLTLTGNQASFSWTKSTDDWYVAGYRIFDGENAVANAGPTATSFVLDNVAPGPHVFKISAFDTASPRGAGADIIAQISSGLGNLYGNLSAPATSGSTTADDVTAPSAPTNLQGIAHDDGTITLTWTASNDNIGVDHYKVHRTPDFPGNASPVPTSSPFTDGSLDEPLAIGSYDYYIEAFDAADNKSVKSETVTVTVTVSPDLTPPTVPTNVAADNSPDIHGKDVAISWTAATDAGGSGVSSYRIYRSNNGAAAVKIGTVNGATLTYNDLALSPGTYSYSVDAVDSAGNASAQSAGAPVVVAADVPLAGHSLSAFPSRDFISATGYDPTHTYSFALKRGASTYTTDAHAPDATGTIEVNHPAAPGNTPDCWITNTPDMRPGDVIRIIDTTTGIAEQTTVANVTAERPFASNANTVVIHGTAMGNGQRLPIEQLDQRLVSRVAFQKTGGNGKVLRASTDGTLAYDTSNVNNPNWTATYTGLSASDVLLAVGGTDPTGSVIVGAESRAVWLGRDPLALNELTFFENGTGVAGGPVGTPCTAPGETPVAAASFAPANLTFPNTSASPSATSAPVTVTFSNGGGSPMTLTNIYFAGLNPGDFIRPAGVAGGTCPTVPAPLANGASCTVSVQFKPMAIGFRQANLSFSDNATNTTDQTIPLTGTGTDTNAPVFTVSPSTVNFGSVNTGTPSAAQTVTVTKTGGGPLNIATVTVAGANAADFTMTQNCTGSPVLANCAISVVFQPAAVGARSATLTLAHNTIPSGATSTDIALSGTGTSAAPTPTTTLAFGSNPVQFGTFDLRRLQTKDQTVSLRNSGQNATAGLGNITVTGSGYKLQSHNCPATLAKGASCSIVVRFTPPNVAGVSNGSLSATAGNAVPTTVTTSLAATTR
jgi:hypothetical protein